VSPRIVSNKNYVAGWLDCSLHDFLGVLSTDDLDTRHALITCLDSNPNPALLRTKSPELKPLASSLKAVGTALLLPTELLLRTNSKTRIFFGFDELWFFPNSELDSPPPSSSMIGPARINRARFKRISKWMSENACSLALGGGEGLNFVVRAHGLPKSLLGCSIEQPDPSLLSSV
jgi:hypothetical protein